MEKIIAYNLYYISLQSDDSNVKQCFVNRFSNGMSGRSETFIENAFWDSHIESYIKNRPD